MAENKRNIVVVVDSNWMALYVNGFLVDQGRKVGFYTDVAAVTIEHKIQETNQAHVDGPFTLRTVKMGLSGECPYLLENLTKEEADDER